MRRQAHSGVATIITATFPIKVTLCTTAAATAAAAAAASIGKVGSDCKDNTADSDGNCSPSVQYVGAVAVQHEAANKRPYHCTSALKSGQHRLTKRLVK
jgi:hypothetical protein